MEIDTQRLHLREFVQDDWPAILENQRDPRYLLYYPWEDRIGDDAKQFVQMFIHQQEAQPRRKFQLAITLKSDKSRVIGSCGLRRKDDNDWEGDVGYEIAPQHWGKGYATEAALAMVRFGFEYLILHRISSWCIADNVASARVLEKTGLKLEGRLKENEFFKGRWWDTLLFGIVEEEWRQQTNNA